MQLSIEIASKIKIWNNKLNNGTKYENGREIKLQFHENRKQKMRIKHKIPDIQNSFFLLLYFNLYTE